MEFYRSIVLLPFQVGKWPPRKWAAALRAAAHPPASPPAPSPLRKRQKQIGNQVYTGAREARAQNPYTP